MSSLSRITYNSINIDFDRAFNQFMLSNVQNRAVGVTLGGTREQINFYVADRLKIAKRVLSRTFESQLTAFWEYVKSGQTFAFRWDRDLLAYMAFENLLATNDAVAGTLTRATTGTFIHPATGLITSVSSGSSRYPAGKFGSGFLAEAETTNRILRSKEFDHAVWVATNVTVSANTAETKDPFGTTTSEKCVASATNGTLRQDTAISISNTNAVFSVWLKSGSASAVQAVLEILRTDTGAILAAEIVSVTARWQRFQVYYSSPSAPGTNWGVQLKFSNNGGRYYVSAGQFEIGRGFATSFVETSTATATRNADQLVYAASDIFDDEPITGSISFWFTPLFNAVELLVEKHFVQIQGLNIASLFILKLASGNIVIEAGNKEGSSSSASGSSSGYFSRNVSLYLVFTWDYDSPTNGLKLYANGALIGQANLVGYPDRIGSNFRIGHSSTAGHEACGVIDDLELRRDVLTAAEILARYNMAKPLGWRRNYWSSLMIDDDAYAPELLVGGYRWGMELNFVEQK